MSRLRIAVIFDDLIRHDTTGVYCLPAMGELAVANHIRPSQLENVQPGDFDLFLVIDDGLGHALPSPLRPSAWWAFDTHMSFSTYRERAPGFDIVFAAQRDGTDRLRDETGQEVVWLPAACDPQIHRKHDCLKQYDVAFVGNHCPGPRSELLSLVRKKQSSHFVGNAYFEEMARIYSASRVIFNRSVANDINMRVFEALACGSLLLTNDLTENGLPELFADGVHLATYREPDELLDKLEFYLKNEDVRERIAAAGQAEALAKHTYRHRMETILTRCHHILNGKRITAIDAARRRPTKGTSYFEHPRPELLALVPQAARRVLDVGCAAGRLGEAIKCRQQAEVVGIDLDDHAAEAARTRLDRVITGDIEQIALDFPDGRFDCIVCGDILEHLTDPLAFLKHARRWLDPDGCLVASIPNVRHHSVVSALVEGNWTYEPAGLLDDTHLQFFTRRDIEELFCSAAFRLEETQVVPGPGHAEWHERGRPNSVQLANLNITGLPPEDAEEFFAYQYLVVAKPSLGAARPENPDDPGTSAPAKTGSIPKLEPVLRSLQVANLGCVLAVFNRPPEYLERTFQTFDYQTVRPKDAVLIDYGSDPDNASVYYQLCMQYGWRMVHVEPRESGWCLSAAYNLAVAALDSGIETVFKSDVDVLLSPSVLEIAAGTGRQAFCHFSYFTTHEEVRYPPVFRSRTDLADVFGHCPKSEPSVGDGVFACPRAWFEGVGGYDMQYKAWGYEDHDLFSRACLSIEIIDVNHQDALLIHQWHPRPVTDETSETNRPYFEKMQRSGQVIRNNGWRSDTSQLGIPYDAPVSRFFIKRGYASRTDPIRFSDDSDHRDGAIWQPDAYRLADLIAKWKGCDTIIDLGCGSGEKLAALSGGFERIIGVDVGDNLRRCAMHVPCAELLECDLEYDLVVDLDDSVLESSIILCADVIEHLRNPLALLRTLRRLMITAPLAVLTTPERDVVWGRTDEGPPMNVHHAREWNSSEFGELLRYMGLQVSYIGLTADNDRDRRMSTILALILGGTA